MHTEDTIANLIEHAQYQFRKPLQLQKKEERETSMSMSTISFGDGDTPLPPQIAASAGTPVEEWSVFAGASAVQEEQSESKIEEQQQHSMDERFQAMSAIAKEVTTKFNNASFELDSFKLSMEAELEGKKTELKAMAEKCKVLEKASIKMRQDKKKAQNQLKIVSKHISAITQAITVD